MKYIHFQLLPLLGRGLGRGQPCCAKSPDLALLKAFRLTQLALAFNPLPCFPSLVGEATFPSHLDSAQYRSKEEILVTTSHIN
jgi:hypothetical protein